MPTTNKSPVSLRRGSGSLSDYHLGMSLGVASGGNVYYVIQTTNDDYTRFVRDMQFTYPDGTSAVQPTITAALAATVSERNDYVYVMPDAADYDEGAVLTMDKHAVHLIGVGGVGAEFGSLHTVIEDANSAAVNVNITGRGVEVAGIRFRGAVEKTVITCSGTGCWIHHNDIAIASTSSSGTLGAGIDVTGTGCKVEHNFVHSNAGLSATIPFGIRSQSGATRAIFYRNLITVSNGCTMTVGLQLGGNDVMSFAIGNILGECAAGGSTLAGTMTAGITVGTGTFAIDNRVAIATAGNGVTGGTSGKSFITNYEGTSGGTLLT